MATPKTAAAAPERETVQWGTQQAEVLAGADLKDKAELIGTEFAVTGFKFTHNLAQNISYVYVEFEFKPNGERFQFNDSSTGVRQQIETYASERGLMTGELDVWKDCLIVCPKGLRVSRYDVDTPRGPRESKTYYLTGLGKRG